MGKWKKEAERLRLQVQEYQRFEASMHEHLDRVSANMDRLWEAVGEEPGDRNEHGVRSLAVVLERRMAELRQLRHVAMLRPEPEARVCSGAMLEIWWPCQRKTGPWKSHRTPCATMTGCVGRAWLRCQHDGDPRKPSHTHPCGVMS